MFRSIMFRSMLVMEAKLVVRDAFLPLLGLALPLVLLVGLGTVPSIRKPDAALGGLRGIDTIIPSMSVTVALAMVSFVMLPVYLATYRERGILRRLATTPVRPRVLLGAQLAIHLVVFVFAVVLVVGTGILVLGMAAPRHPLAYVGVVILSMLALFAIGLLVAALAPGAKSANGIGFVLWFTSAFFAGIYVPREYMPHALQRICDFTPLGAAREAMQDAWGGAGPHTVDLVVLAAFAAVASIVAARCFRWQ